ncbi:MAG: hypothetical protein R6V55_04975 [Desulfovermiculus sp.]
MTSTTDRLSKALDQIWKIPPQRPQVDLEQLGADIQHVPPYLWQERMLFHGAPDQALQTLTTTFPRHIRTSHPIFVLQAISRLAVLACPCTSSPGPWAYIPRNTRLEITDRIINRTSFVLEELSFPVPKDRQFTDTLSFWGQVPTNKLMRVG